MVIYTLNDEAGNEYPLGVESDNVKVIMNGTEKLLTEVLEEIKSANLMGEGEKSLVNGSTNQAITENSVAFGQNSLAGCRGYYFSAIDTTNKKIYLTTEQVTPVWTTEDLTNGSVVCEYVPGDKLAFENGSKYYPECYVESVNGNCITYTIDDNGLGFDSFSEEVGTDEFSIYVIAKPNVGYSVVKGFSSQAMGYETIAIGNFSQAEGCQTTAVGDYSHAEGRSTVSYYAAHAEGRNTVAEGHAAHSEGYQSKALNDATHAEGYSTQATNIGAHAEGYNAIASGKYSHAAGVWTRATKENQYVVGKYNAESDNAIFIVGNGSSSTRKNAFETGADSTGSFITVGSTKIYEEQLQKLLALI